MGGVTVTIGVGRANTIGSTEKGVADDSQLKLLVTVTVYGTVAFKLEINPLGAMVWLLSGLKVYVKVAL